MDRQIRAQEKVLSPLFWTQSNRNELLLFGLLAGLGAAASYFSINIPYTQVHIDGRLAFGFMGFALLRRWWAALLLACLLSVTGFHQVPVTVYLPANLLNAIPCLITIRLVHGRFLSRFSHLTLYGIGWFLLVLACYQLFITPLIWAVLAVLRDGPIWPAVLAGWQQQPFLVESVLVGIVSALGMTVVRSYQALHQSRQELATTLDSIGDGVIATDAQGRVTRMNPVAQILTGWTLAEAQGRPLKEVLCLVNAQTRQPVANPVDRVLHEGVIVGLANHTSLIAKDGTERQIADSAAPIRQVDGRLIGTVLVFRDVTQEYEARAALRESEQYQQALIQASPLAILSLDSTGQVLTWNDAARRMFGWTEAEAVGQPLPLIFTGEQEGVGSLWHRVLAGATFADREAVYRKKDGSPIEVTLSAAPIRNAAGRPTAIMVILEEISERKLRQKMNQVRMRLLEFAPEHTLEELLRKTLDEIGQLVDSPLGFYHFVEADQKTLSLQAWSTQTLERFCRAEGQDLHYNIDEAGVWVDCVYQRRPVIHNDYASLPHRKGLPEDHAAVIRELVVPIFRDDRIVAILGVGNKPQDYTDQDVEIVAYLADVIWEIARHKQAEAERERLMAAVEQAGEIIVITNPEATIQYVNPAFERITGYSRQEILGQSMSILKSDHHDERFYRQLWRTLARGQNWQGQFVNKRKNGTLYTEEATLSPVRDSSGQIVNYVGVKRDITEYLRINEEKAKLEAQFQQTQKLESIGRLAGGVAHDLNNLLTPILGYGELLLDDFEGEDVRKTDVEKIVQAAGRARDLVRQLLAFSRKQELALEPVDLNTVLDGFEILLRRAIREDVALQLHLAPSLPLLEADIGQLEQVIMNLAVNAQDAMPDGGTLTIQTGLTELDQAYAAATGDVKPGLYLMLAVSDTGCGIDAETRQHLFEPFFTTKSSGKGTGLGLAIVYGIIKQHGGHIWVYSEPDQGATFKIYLPVSETTQSQRQETPVTPAANLSGSETILLVEDDRQVRELSKVILNKHGYRVLIAKSGPEALAVLAGHAGPVHLLLTDVVLPGMNGRELFNRISEQLPRLKVLYMSGYTDEVIAHRGVLEEGVNFIQKPFSVQALAATVREVLDKDDAPPRISTIS